MQDMKIHTEECKKWNIPENARKFHYWRGFVVGAVVGGVLMFVVMGNIIIYLYA